VQADFEKRADPADKEQQELLGEMKAHMKKVNAAAACTQQLEWFLFRPWASMCALVPCSTVDVHRKSKQVAPATVTRESRILGIV
jgi:hypothetical protein